MMPDMTTPFARSLTDPSFTQPRLRSAARFSRQHAAAIGTLATLLLGSNAASGAAAADDSGNVDFPRYPSLSPDGTTVVFSWRGDLWIASSGGGAATRLTSHPADELRSSWSPDGSRIVFESTRDGVRNLWSMRADGTAVSQLTKLDVPVTLSAVGALPDGRVAAFFDAARENDFFRSPRPYQVELEGGPIQRVHDAFGSRSAPSADGQTLLFDRGGASWSRRGFRGSDTRDVWLLDRRDGSYRRLTAWAGNDGGARFGRSGEVLYLSDAEDGVVNVYARTLDAPAESAGRKLTSLVRDGRDLAVSADGRTAVFGSWGRLHRLDLGAPTPRDTTLAFTASEDARSEPRWRRIDRDVTEAALNPDGASVALVAYGDLFVRSLDEKALPVRITETPSREYQIAWSPDGRTLYFTSDENGREEIRVATVKKTRSEVRRDFDRDEESGSATGEAGAPPTDAAAASAKVDSNERGAGDWADAVTFEVRTLVSGDEPVRHPDPSPDGTALAYRRGAGALCMRALDTGEERCLRNGWDPGLSWRFSPDGRWIAIVQEDRDFNSDIWVAPVDGSTAAVNITRHPDSDLDPRWSADSRILAFRSDRVNNEFDIWSVALDKSLEGMSAAEREKYFRDAAESSKKRKPLGVASKSPSKEKKGAQEPAERPAGGAGEPNAPAAPATQPTPSASPASVAPPEDGARTTGGHGAGQDDTADKEKTGSREKKDPPKPAKLSLDDVYLRVTRITTMAGSEGNLEMTPGGDRLIFTSTAVPDPEADEPGTGDSLLSVKWDGSDQKRLGAGARVEQVSLTGDKVLLLRDGRPATVPPSGGESKSIDFAASTRIDPSDQVRRRFLGVASALGEGFYHPTMKGLDWPALTAQYLELASATRTADEFDDVASRFIGELNASHLGVTSPPDGGGDRRPQGRLGVRSEAVDGGYRVTEVLQDGPAARAPTPLVIGDVITSIDGVSAAGVGSLEELLAGRVGQESIVTLRRTLPTGVVVNREALIVPVGSGEIAALAYREHQRRMAALVSEWSNGRIGYIHVQGMDQPSLDRFERDLFAAAEGREGLLIDVRNNGGGWTADRLLASIMAPVHAYTVPRGADPEYRLGYPRDRLFIQRYPLPINLLANEKSFSNAEIIAHAFKTLKRGTLVGETTGGGVISTGSVRLLDGTSVRMPFRGWYLPDGADMENNGAVPDLRVPQTPQDEARGEDAQLRRAVDDLLGRLGGGTKRATGEASPK